MTQKMKNSVQFPHLKSCFLFEDVEEQQTIAFLDGYVVTVHRTPEAILSQDELPPGLFVIASGSVEISCVTEAGDRAIITHLGSGDTVGEPELIAQMPCVCSAIAQPGTVTLFCPATEFAKLIRHEMIVRNIMRSYVGRLKRDNKLKAIDQFFPVEQRITSYLLHLSDANFVLRVSQSYLANAAGCSRQTVNKVLGRLKEAGQIAIRKGEIQILKPADLSAIAIKES